VIDEALQIQEENRARDAREQADGLHPGPVLPLEILGADDWGIYAADAMDRVFCLSTECWPEWLDLPDGTDQEPHSVARCMIPLLQTGTATFAAWQRVDARWEGRLPQRLVERWVRYQLVAVADDRTLSEHPDWFACQDALDEALNGGQFEAGDLESRPMLDLSPAEHHPSCALNQFHGGVCQSATGLALPPLRDVSRPNEAQALQRMGSFAACQPQVEGSSR
jgi:hypothetical protein